MYKPKCGFCGCTEFHVEKDELTVYEHTGSCKVALVCCSACRAVIGAFDDTVAGTLKKMAAKLKS